MTHLTVGTGGDYAGWVEVYDYLVGLGNLADDYELEQISDVTITAWPGTSVKLNGHYVLFYCAWDNSHQGDPTRGYITYCNGATAYFRPTNDNSCNTGTWRADNLYFIQQTNAVVILVNPTTAVNILHTINVQCDNILIKGFGAFASAIQLTNSVINYRFRNVKIWNWRYGFQTNYSGWVGLVRSRNIENVTVWNCSQYCFDIQGLSNLTNFYNCYGSGCTGMAGDQDWSGGHGANTTLNDCADSENSIVNFLNATETNCLANVDETTELLSLDDTNEDFLRINPDSDLYAEGTLVITNTESIEGYPRPNAFGVCSIGASEPNVEIDFTGNPLIANIGDTITYTSIINEAIIDEYSWNLDDDKTKSTQNCSTVYSVTGLKTITLIVTDMDGRTATVTKTDYVEIRGYELGLVGKPIKGIAPLVTQFNEVFNRL